MTIYIHGLNNRENEEKSLRPIKVTKIYKKEHPEQRLKIGYYFIFW